MNARPSQRQALPALALTLCLCLLPSPSPAADTPGSASAAVQAADALRPAGARLAPRRLDVNAPRQESFETGAVQQAALTPDARRLVLARLAAGYSELWLRGLAPGPGGAPDLPLRLAPALADRLAPALSPDGRWLAFVGLEDDVTGDLYLLDLSRPEAKARKLTGRGSEDGAPCFAPDGLSLYFQQRQQGASERRIAVLDLSAPAALPRVLDTGGDASAPALSPDGRRLAFVSARAGRDAVYVMDLPAGAPQRLTAGLTPESTPCFGADGASVFFVQGPPQAAAGLAEPPQPVLALADAQRPGAKAQVLTSARQAALAPRVAGGRLYFLSPRNGPENLWSLPLSGEIPRRGATELLALADEIAAQTPVDRHLAALAYGRAAEAASGNAPLAARALYAQGRQQEALGLTALAVSAHEEASALGAQPESGLATVRLALLRAAARRDQARNDAGRQEALRDGLKELAALRASPAGRADPRVARQAALEQARLLLEHGGDPRSLSEALRILDAEIGSADAAQSSAPQQRAEALFLKAETFGRIGQLQAVLPLYAQVIARHPEDGPWADLAVSRVLDLSLAGAGKKPEERAQALALLAEQNRTALPKLSLGALNRQGDVYFSADEWAKAKDAYRQTLTAGAALPQAATQVAAARLALAEILYREERFHQALDLYESEMASRPYEDRLYRLAKAAHLRKSVAAGDFLLRLGEVPAASAIFAGLLRDDPDFVPAHRGLIRASAALRTIPATLADYRSRLAAKPGDPTLLYATGLTLTYLDGKGPLLEARALVARAIDANGQVEYFHQTLGYIDEVLETVHGERGRLEAALDSYQRARFLNSREQNPENAANLDLNIGNVHFLLGQYADAFEEYRKRQDAKVPFDNEETEIVFHQRLGVAAFQARERTRPAEAFSRALELVERRIQPRHASEVFGRMGRHVFDRVLTPALSRADLGEDAKALARRLAARQSDLNNRLFEASTKPSGPPPDPAWNVYVASVQALLAEQERLVSDLTPLLPTAREEREASVQTLAAMAIKVREALGFPPRFVQLRAELYDRLGLARQEAGDWRGAREAFEQALALNTGLGLTSNLAANQRSVAYNAFMEAGLTTGQERDALLDKAEAGFRRVPELAAKYGVADKKGGGRKKGLINLDIDVALDKGAASQASYGFSAAQEQRIAEAFLARIATERGRPREALGLIERQSGRFEKGETPPQEAFGAALLLHRAGLLENALGNSANAFERFRRSAGLALDLGNAVSASQNVADMSAALLAMPAGAERDARLEELRRLEDRAALALRRAGLEADGLAAPAFHNILAAGRLALADRLPGADAAAAALRMELYSRAGQRLAEGLAWFAAHPPATRRALALNVALRLNQADLALRLGEDEDRTQALESALVLAERGLLPGLRWRALAGLGRLPEALAQLEVLPPDEAACGPGEVQRGFSPLVAGLLSAGKAEDAFNLLERLGELERVGRMGGLGVPAPSAAELPLLRRSGLRLLALRDLRARLAGAKAQDLALRTDLTRRMTQEQEILDRDLGPDRALLPAVARLGASREEQDWLTLLFGLSAELAARAEAVAAAGDGANASALRRSHAELALRLAGLKAEAARSLGRLDTPGLLALLLPAPVQAVDLMENLPKGTSALRLALLPGGRWAGIRLDEDSVKALSLGDGPVPALPAPAAKEKRLLLFEAPELLAPQDLRAAPAVGLSGTHMARSLAARKPFRRNLLFVGAGNPAPKGFDTQTSSAAPSALAAALPKAHTLVAGAPVRLADTAPSRQDELPVRFLALSPEGLEPSDLGRLAAHMRDVSLAVLPRVQPGDIGLLAQLMALQGVPSVLAPTGPGASDGFVAPFLGSYAEAPASSARALAQDAAAQPWLLLGDPGLGVKEAAAFAATQFARYVRSAIAASGAGRLDLALSRYDNALRVVRNTGQFKEREPELLEHMRKAAFDLGDFERAEGLGRELLALQAKAKPDSQAHAGALLGLGSVLAEREKYAEAVKLLEQALEMIQNLELSGQEIDALVRLGATLEKAVQYDKALGRFEGAARLSRKAGARELLAQQHMRIGRILDLRLSRYVQAKAAYAEALALYTELGRTPERLEALLNLGRCARLLGGFAEADARYAEALKLAGSGRELERQRLRILLEQANNAWQQARYQEAFDLERRVLKGAEQNGWVAEQVMARNTAGLLWWSLGDHERALREFDTALPQAKSLRIRQDEVATTLNNRGLVERDMGRPELALKTLGEALDIDRGLRSRWAVAYDLRNLAQTHLRMGDAKKALPLLDEALGHTEAIGDGVNRAKVLLALGEAQLSLDARDKARDTFAKADALAASLGLRDSRWRALHGLARLELAAKNLPRARALLEQAAELIEGMRAELKVDQLKDGFMADKSVVYEDLALLLADQGEVAEAFRTAERSRSRNLMDLLGNKRLAPRRPEDRALYQRLDSLRARVAEQETLLAQARAQAERDVYGRGLKQAQDDYRDTLLELQASRPDLASLVSVNPLSLAEVQKLLEPGVALLAYYVTRAEVLCWTVGGARTELTRIPLGREGLGRMVLAYRRMLQNLEPLDAQSKELYDLLLAPVLRTLPPETRELGIIPHDALHTLSFASLSGGEDYLVDRYPLFQLPSASVFRFTLERRKAERNTRVLAVGNPDLHDQSLELPFAEREVGSLAWNYPGMTALTREKATKDWITRHIGEFGIIHLATHGEFDPVNPLFSALKLAGTAKEADGDLEAAEIFDLRLNADLIVLSACQTGLGKVTSGDEVQGLNQAFLFAGTHALISSLWRVSDISTAMLMKQFYREHQTRPKAESLRRAMLHVKTRFPHPGYWAAFTLTGDYK